MKLFKRGNNLTWSFFKSRRRSGFSFKIRSWRHTDSWRGKPGARSLKPKHKHHVKRSPALWTGLSAFWPYRTYFFLPGFLCAELFFLVGLFFLGWAVFFDIQFILRLVKICLWLQSISSRSSMLCFQKRQLNSQNTSKRRYAYKGQYDIWSRSATRAYCKPFHTVFGILNKK